MNGLKVYSALADVYDLGLKLNGYAKTAKHFVRQLPLPADRPLRVLDVGCGTGLLSLCVLEQWPKSEVVAFDLSPQMVRRARQNLAKHHLASRAIVVTSDIFDLEWLDGEFDFVIVAGVLEHLGDRLAEALVNLTERLRAGGHFFITSVSDNLMSNVLRHFFGFQPLDLAALEALFVRHGLQLKSRFHPPVGHRTFSSVRVAYLFQKSTKSANIGR